MIHISDFDKEFKGRTFQDQSGTSSDKCTCIGYGESQGAPYLVGLVDNNGSVVIKTVLFRNVKFV